ncbi:MAG: hypothetical protein Q8918_16290 [Bacteroidota bacterium]|nr:hypothetical protein [Bacteroidota bacterium]MDP4211748.1 hypothetical protein [Bacteroidota bacterium]MDP4251662.1 hypothetical protein [Bacteroidota bacterium]
MKPTNLCYLLILLSFGSCISPRSYYMSPMDINSLPYHTLPNTTDSQRAATYASLSIHAGGSNQTVKDGVSGMRGDIHRAYRFGNFQAYYGGGISLGNYHLHESDHTAYNYSTMSDTTYHFPTSDKFFGSYGFGGGINLVIPFAGGRGEWRVIGFETSFQKEFGDYVKFRKQLRDSAYDILATYGQIFTVGGTTELVGISRHGTEIGYKVALGSVLFPKGSYLGPESDFHPYYMSHTLHVTKRKVTGFMQFNIGAHALSLQFGVNYNLSKKSGM